MEIRIVSEGSTTFSVPVQDIEGNFPPNTAPVFFNPRMKLNRDSNVLFYSVVRPVLYLDLMGASGVRGLRIRNETGIPVIINDKNPVAVELIQKNVRDLGLSIEVSRTDANVLLSSGYFDAVDIDPFGSPAYFIDAAGRGAGRYLSVTATDTAPLCGAHKNAGIRRYSSVPLVTHYHPEVGIRILLGFVTREIAKYDRGVVPLFCFAREHYVRLNLQLKKGAREADKSLNNLGFLHQCSSCSGYMQQKGLVSKEFVCTYCKSSMIPIGPLWLGNIFDNCVLTQMLEKIETLSPGSNRELEELIKTCLGELTIPGYYDYHKLSKKLGVSPKKISKILLDLENHGFFGSRVHCSGTGIKTDAPLHVLKSVVSAQ